MDINILIAGNNTYSFGINVFVISLLENSKRRSVHIYFMYNDFSEENQHRLRKTVTRYFGCTIDFIYIGEKFFSYVPLKATTNKYITVETYFRMAMSEVLPENIDRILYLDTDIIVDKDYLDFYNLELGEDIVAYVCQDYGLVMNDKVRKNVYHNLAFNETDLYFNAGVLLLNMKNVRRYFSLDVFKEFILNNYNKLIFHDQDVLNKLFRGRVEYVDYNIYDCRPFYYPYSKAYNKKIVDTAVIIHYGEKPWNADFTDLAGELFWKYALIGNYTEEHSKWLEDNKKYKSKNCMKIVIKIIKRNVKAFIMKLDKGKLV